VFSPCGTKVLASASTLEAEVRAELADKTVRAATSTLRSLSVSVLLKRPRLPASNPSPRPFGFPLPRPRESAG